MDHILICARAPTRNIRNMTYVYNDSIITIKLEQKDLKFIKPLKPA